MLGKEPGTCSGSDLYFQTPSDNARQMLYYMTSCGYYYTDYSYRIERENYQNFLIFYICEGRLSVTCGGEKSVAETGQVGFIDCHQPHEYHAIGNAEFIWLHLNGCNISAFYDQVLHKNNGFIFTAPNAAEIKQRIYAIVYACRNDQTLNEFRLSHRLYGILTALLDSDAESDDEKSGQSPCAIAMQFIKSHYGEPISLPDVADSVNMSQYHFARLFKKECGYSPHEYLILTRLNRAKLLLKTTNMPIKTIAQDVGYQNVTTFTNAFTSKVGLSPTLFRKYPV